MDIQSSRRSGSSWLIAIATLTLIAVIGFTSFSVSATPLVADLSTSTLTVDKPSAKKNETITYELKVTNTGNDGAGGTVVTNVLPAGLTYVGTPTVTGAGVGTISGPAFSGQDMTWEGTVSAASEAVITFSAKVPSTAMAGEEYVSNTSIMHSSGDVDLSAKTTVVTALPDLSTSTKTANKDKAKVGDTIRYSIEVVNTGVDAAGAVDVTDVLPSEVTYVADSASISGSGYATILSIDVSGGELTWQGTVESGGQATIVFDVTVNSGVALNTIITNEVDIDDNLNAIITREAETEVVLQTQTFVYLPLAYKPVPAPVIAAGTVNQSGDNATWNITWADVLPNVNETYIIQEATDANFTQNVQTSTTTNRSKSYTHPAGNGETYYYRVRVSNPLNSGWSNVVSVSLESNLKLDRSSLSAGARDCTLLRWDYQGITSFKINFAEGFSKVGTSGTGTRRVCPSVTTTYEAEVTYADGRVLRPKVVATVDNSDGKCNRDPYIVNWGATASSVPVNTEVTIAWDVQCAGEVYLRLGSEDDGAEFFGTSGTGQRPFVITGDTEFTLRAVSDQPQGRFEEESTFTVTVTR